MKHKRKEILDAGNWTDRFTKATISAATNYETLQHMVDLVEETTEFFAEMAQHVCNTMEDIAGFLLPREYLRVEVLRRCYTLNTDSPGTPWKLDDSHPFDLNMSLCSGFGKGDVHDRTAVETMKRLSIDVLEKAIKGDTWIEGFTLVLIVCEPFSIIGWYGMNDNECKHAFHVMGSPKQNENWGKILGDLVATRSTPCQQQECLSHDGFCERARICTLKDLHIRNNPLDPNDPDSKDRRPHMRSTTPKDQLPEVARREMASKLLNSHASFGGTPMENMAKELAKMFIADRLAGRA